MVWLNGKVPQSDEAAVSAPDFVDYRVDNRSSYRLAAFGYSARPSNLVFDKPEQVFTTIATAGFFETLGIRPVLGRDFLPSDEQAPTPQSAILGYGIWRRGFGANPDVVGRNIRIDGQSLTVIGVLLVDLPLLSQAEIWLPVNLSSPQSQNRLAHFLKVVARLKPGVSMKRS